MTQQIEQAEETVLTTTRTKPPPRESEVPRRQLFQTIDDLHVRHGNLPAAKDRLYLWAGGFLGGSFVFGALYLMILFLE
jgi:hypothetical protein